MFLICSLHASHHRRVTQSTALMPGEPGSLFERPKPELIERTEPSVPQGSIMNAQRRQGANNDHPAATLSG